MSRPRLDAVLAVLAILGLAMLGLRRPPARPSRDRDQLTDRDGWGWA